MTKYCNKCKSTKDSSLFYKCSSKKDKKSSNCKKCDDITKANWRKNNPEKVKIYEKRRWKNGDKREKDYARGFKYRIELADTYIRDLIIKNSDFLIRQDISDEMIEIYRLNLKIKRIIGITPKLGRRRTKPQ